MENRKFGIKPWAVLLGALLLAASVSAITFTITFSNGFFSYQTNDFNAQIGTPVVGDWYYWTGTTWKTGAGNAVAWLDANSDGNFVVSFGTIAGDCNWGFVLKAASAIADTDVKTGIYDVNKTNGVAIAQDKNVFIAVSPKSSGLKSCSLQITDFNIISN